MRVSAVSAVFAAFTVVTGLSLARPAEACFAAVYRPPPADKTAQLDASVMRIAVAHDGERTTWTLDGQVKGDVRRFSLMIPVPAKVNKRQVRVVKSGALDVLDRATAPRVDERHDPDPCAMVAADEAEASDMGIAAAPAARAASGAGLKASDYGVAVESHIQVGGYDIAVLAAKDAKGLARWLRRFKYDVPEDVERLMTDYLSRDWRFLVARVNLKKLVRERFTSLRPLQIRFRSAALELPVRIGAVAARGEPVDLSVFALSERGLTGLERALVSRAPAQQLVPPFAVRDPSELHEAVLGHTFDENPHAVVLEFSGVPRNVGYPTASTQLAELGAAWAQRGKRVWATRYRLRLRDDPARDVVLAPTDDQGGFEVVYRAQNPWQPPPSLPDEQVCDAGQRYLRALATRVDQEAETLARITGWDREEILRRRGDVRVIRAPPPRPHEPPPAPGDPPPEPVPGEDDDGPSSTTLALGLAAFVAALIGIGRWQRRG